MTDYMNRHRADPEVYIDFTTYYRKNELKYATPAYGGLLNGPSWQRFVVWWHTTMRTNTQKSHEEKESLQWTLATYLDQDGWNYINGISRGCTTFIGPGDIDDYKELNYLILQACNYYEKVDAEHWTSPVLMALRLNQRIPLTTSDGPTYLEPATPGMQDHYTCIDYLVDFGVNKMDYMDAIWKLSEETTQSTTSQVDMKATMEAIRGTVMATKKSRL